MKQPHLKTPVRFFRRRPDQQNLFGAVFVTSLTMAFSAMLAPLASAQTVQIRSAPMRVTVADAATSSTVLTNYVVLGGSPGTESLNVYGLPGSANYSYSVASGSATFATLLTLNAANVPNGEYTFDINASGGAVNDLYLTLQSGRMWTGTTNLSTTWSSSSSWVGGVPPTSSSDVLFTQIGAQTNMVIGGVFSPNSVVDQNFTVSSLRFSQTNGGTTYQTININSNITLAVTGTNGVRLLQDYFGIGSGMNAIFSGANGTLEVSNSAANITMLEDNSTTHTLDMSRLGTFVANINRLAPGDYTLYPNWTNAYSQGYSASSLPFIYPNKFYPKLNLAQTNFVKALYVDPYNYTNPTSRSYALELVNNPVTATSSSATPTVLLGITNVFNLDGVCIAGFGGTTAAFNFNPSLYVTTNVVGTVTNYVTNRMVAVFRNTDGISRMSTFCVADLAGPMTNANGNTKGNVNFGAYNGYVDMLVDRFYLSRDRTNVFSSSGDDAQSTFGMGAGTVDANTAIIGDQENGNQLFMNYVYGTLAVSNTAVFKVNKSLQLGYETAGYGDASLPGDTYGIINVGPGGTVIANAIGVGGITKNSGKVGSAAGTVNTITLTNGATLIVSNTIADASSYNNSTVTAGVYPGMLGAFNIYNSTLELNVNGTNSGAYVFTSALNYTGSVSNSLVIATIKNLTIPTGGSTNIPLIWIQGASGGAGTYAAAFSKVIVPSGYNGALILDATNSQILDLSLSTHSPRNLKWEGYLSGNWDTTTQNWLDLNTGLHTNFDNGDFTTFDDSSSVTNITITSTVSLIPNNVTVTNSLNYYTFSGSGSLNGGATITKSGTGVLEIDSPITLGLQINQGSVVGSGSLASVSVATGSTLNYSGSSTGVSCAGTGVNRGTINGILTVLSGGVFTNGNILNGTFSLPSGGLFYNAGTITYASGISTIGTNAWMINSNTINGDQIIVNAGGTFEDLGMSTANTLTSITVSSGGTFIPGAGGLGTTTIGSDGVGNYPGAALLTQGSTNYFQINLAGPKTNTVLILDSLSFGASASVQSQNGATIVLNNIGSIPFAVGQYFHLFDNFYSPGYAPYSTGSSTNTYPVILPATPGAGLAWDLSQLWKSGNIGVVSASSGPTFTSSFAVDSTGTNLIGQFSWPSGYYGYRLETLVTPNTVGVISSTNYPWTTVSGSWTNTTVSVTNALGKTNLGTNCVFYRLVYP